MITPATPIRGQGGNPLRDKGRAVEHAGQFLPPGMDAMTNTYLLELSRVCATEGLNYRVAVAQWDLETDRGRSPRWIAHRNPAGLGIEQDDDPDPATWTGVEAARVHAWALAHASDPTIFPPPGYLPTSADPFVRRWVDKYADPNCPIVRTVADLNRRYADRHGEMQATWAWDPGYPLKLAARANAIFKEETMPTLVIGQSERPAIVDDIVDKPQGMGWDDYGPRTLRAIVLHRVLGAAKFTSSHFRNLSDKHGRNALTDWGICGALDGDMDGVILRWNDPDGRRSPWASGPLFSVSGQLLANGDAVGFYNRYVRGDPAGANVINRDTEAFELSGYYNTPITKKQLDALVKLAVYRLDVKMKLPWTRWPRNHEGEQAILVHGEVNGWLKKCPGDVVIAMINQIIDLIGEGLRSVQERGVIIPTPDPKPEPLPNPGYRPSHARLAEWFGEAVVDGKRLSYNRRGPISTIWRRRGRATGQYPSVDPTGSHRLDDGTLIVRFMDGWVVVDPRGASPAAPLGRAA